MPPTYYRGCWHVVSRGLFIRYSHSSSLIKEVYNPKTFFLHAALLGQAFAHCPIFPTAASRRSLDRLSVPMWPFNLSVRLLIADLVGRYLTNYLIRHEPISQRIAAFPAGRCLPAAYAVLATFSRCYPPLKGKLLMLYSPVRH